MTDASRNLGDIVNGRYLLTEPLGTGSMGQVFLAHDGILNVSVAMKYLLGKNDQRVALDYFRQEFSLLTTLHHPHVTRVFDLAQDEQTGAHFFTSEFVRGTDLYLALQTRTPLTAMPLIVQALQALDYLHTHHVYHFDIKPQNILVAQQADDSTGESAHVKLIDFGMSAVARDNKIVGTPSYIAPEVLQRDFPDHRADLYSFGVLLYYALTQHNPFRGDHRDDTFRRHLTLIPPPPSSLNPDIPGVLDDIILRLLAKKREDRFPSAWHVIDAIQEQAALEDTTSISLTSRPLTTPTAWEGPFIGRAELLHTTTALIAACREGQDTIAPLYCVTGAPGTGKTRLLREMKFLAQLAGCVTHTFDRTDVTARLAWLAQLEAARDGGSEASIFFVDDVAPLIDSQAALEMVDGLRALVQALRRREPGTARRVLVVVSADPSSATQQQLVRTFRLTPPEISRLPLANFTPAEFAEFLRAVGGPENPTLTEHFFRETAGNPLAISRLMTALQGDAHPDATRAARTPPAQPLLALLAVWTQPASTGDLADILGVNPSREMLHALAHDGVLRHDPLCDAWMFQSESMRAEQYAAHDPVQRAVWHDHIATHLLQSANATLDQIFFHQSRGTNPDATQRELWMLAHEQMRLQQWHAATSTLTTLLSTRAFASGSVGDVEIRLLLARTFRMSHRFRATARVCASLQPVLIAVPQHRPRLARLYEELALTALQQLDVDTAETAFTQSLTIVNDGLDHPCLAVRLQQGLGEIALHRGDYRQAITTLKTAAARQKLLSAADQHKITRYYLGEAYLALPDFPKALDHLQQEIRQATACQQPRAVLRAQWLLTRWAVAQGQTPQATEQLQAIVCTPEHAIDADVLAQAEMDLGTMYSAANQIDTALAMYRAAAEHARNADQPALLIAAFTLMGNMHRRAGEVLPAEQALRCAITHLDTLSAPLTATATHYCTVHFHLGSLFLRTTRYAASEYHLCRARTLATQYPACRDRLYRIVLTLAEWYRLTGDAHRARAELAHAKTLIG